MDRSVIICLTLVFYIFTLSCQNNKGAGAGVNNYDAPVNNTPLYAERFLLEPMVDYSRLVIKDPWQGAKNITQEYFLVRRGNEIPDSIDSKKVIFVPVEKIVCLSTTHVAMISALGMQSTIVAVSGADYIFNEEMHEATEAGSIKDVGYEDNLNKEMILDLDPDLVMVYGIGSESAGYIGKLSELGVKIVFNADYLENDPLGKAEWIKVMGALYCMEQKADSVFSDIAGKYNEIRDMISMEVKTRPSVLLGLPWKDTWYVSPSNSYISRLIEDAGGFYLWNNIESDISLPYGIENVFMKAVNADFWLNAGAVKTKNEITDIDNRLSALKPFINGNIYNNNKRLSEGGGNDYWESGSINPHIVLHDLAVILHPSFFDDKQLYYYTKIE